MLALLATVALLLAGPLQRSSLGRVEVLPDTRVTGRVGSEVHGPFAELRVTAGVRVRGAWPFRCSTRTDSRGRFELDVPSRAALEAALGEGEGAAERWARLLLFVDEPGYQRRLQTLDLPLDREATIEPVQLELLPGASVELRVEDQRGRAASGAVSLHSVRKRKVEPVTSRDRLQDIDTGVYELHVHERQKVDVFVLGTEGSGLVEDVDLRIDRERDPLTVVLQPGGDLAGRLLTPDGDALSDVPLRAYPSALIEDSDPRFSLTNYKARWRQPGGSPTATATTDEQGQFRFRGLAPGSYFVQYDTYDMARRHRILNVGHEMPRKLHAVGDEDVELVVPWYRLVVELVDSAGNPLAETARLRCQATDPALRPYDFSPTARPYAGPAAFDVHAGAEYELLALHPRRGAVDATVRIAEAPYTQHVRLELGPDGDPATLHVRIPASAHGPRDRTVVHLHLQGSDQLRSTATTLVRDPVDDPWSSFPGIHLNAPETNVTPEIDGVTYRIPPGTYWVSAEPVAWSRGLTDRRYQGFRNETVSLQNGEQRTVVLVPWTGGLAELSLEEPLRPWSGSITAIVRETSVGSSGPSELTFEYVREDGVFRVRSPLPAGRYSVQLLARGHRSSDVLTFSVVSNETTQVPVVLRRLSER